MAYNSQSKNVIIMEDDSSISRLLGIVVSRLQFVPYVAENREDFIGLYRSLDYFAIILDNQVPYDHGSNVPRADVGLSLAPQLLKIEPDLRVALHTGDDLKSRISEFEKIGLVYIRKPSCIKSIEDFLTKTKI